ncbi:protein-methionine-sulfoxide reductase heme-binding subunit MsrQ [Roseovarius mucosus]|uniref:protein-methionine-sulfoxide reductase heme-binding subunit MsrQ n=1 Tax=Roseovarius TaxID=74030 RepID=UPI001C5D800B|nr:protein-methionine-sulfoxide reductase heme-binding subunit MsrQ [Roseovarius mucosus]MBW4975962.1 protein-methionine-sulfoxide reductase heme-binding subunit MsrQ [Roseovarius mucosus]|tara:strand:- start:262 stop:864 length:603 start_codon:yes stop_codon:yes gene_type:complete
MLRDQINGLARRVPVWAVWLIGLMPGVWTFYLGLTGGLGAEPIKALERELGEVALQLLILGLCITPLRRHVGVNLIRFRRAVGLLTFSYVAWHLLVWLVLDVQILAQIWADIVKRPYVTIGFAAFLLMIPLALTSNDWSVRRLGPKWRALHRLTYGVAVLGAVHFLWLSKGFQIEPLVYLAVILGLLALRWRPIGQSRRV